MVLSGCAKVALVAVSLTGLIFIIVGSVTHGVFPSIYKNMVNKELVLDESNEESLDRWTSPPVPMYMTFYIFNVTNPNEANTGKEKPKLEELGPFVYKQIKVKNIIERNDKEGYLIYNETTTYFYDPVLSKGVDIDWEIYHINVADLALGKILTGGVGFPSDYMNYFNFLKDAGASGMINFKPEMITKNLGPLIVKNRIGDILFDGCDVPSFKDVANLDLQIPEMFKDMFKLEGKTPTEFIKDKLPPDLKFSAFADRNNTEGPKIKIWSGKSDISKLTVIQEIDDKPRLPFFQTNTTCDMINGTDGMQFPPHLGKNGYIYVYSPDVCRSLQFEYQGSTKLKKIDAFRFILSESVFEDPNANNSDNYCFCKEKKKSECTKKGILPVIYCMPDKPVIAMSAPHLLNADQEYQDNFEGLAPDFEKHGTFLDIEPITGTVIRGVKRLQVNVMEEKIPGFDFLVAEKRRPFPLFWLQEGGEIDEPLAADFRKRVLAPKEGVTWGMIALIAIGMVMILISIVMNFIKRDN